MPKEPYEAAGKEFERVPDAGLLTKSGLLETTVSSIPDSVYAFDRGRRFVYVNRAMQSLFGLPAAEIIGKTFAQLGYPAELAQRLDGHIDRIFQTGATREEEVFYRSPTGYGAYFSFLWGPVFADDGSVELVVGVSRDTTERRAIEERLRESEARLRAASDLLGLSVYSRDPLSGALEWDDRLRTMWGLPAGVPVDMAAFEAGIHPEDVSRVRAASAASIDPAGDGRYDIEYRVIGRDDGIERHIAALGRTIFQQGRPCDFIGTAIDVTQQRRNEAAIRESEERLRIFAEHSSKLLWICDPIARRIEYLSSAYERIWGEPLAEAPAELELWMHRLLPEDRSRLQDALQASMAGDVTRAEFRILRPSDGAMRWLRSTSFPIRDAAGAVVRIGGIAEDLTRDDGQQVYVIGADGGGRGHVAAMLRHSGFRVTHFAEAAAFLDITDVSARGCVLVDMSRAPASALTLARELKARSIQLPVVILGAHEGDITTAIAAMKAGALDYLTPPVEEAALRSAVSAVLADTCRGEARATGQEEEAAARVARLTCRERDVLSGLVGGGTNKSIARALGISPRTVELHRAQLMSRLNARSLVDLLQVALAAGIPAKTDVKVRHRRGTQTE